MNGSLLRVFALECNDLYKIINCDCVTCTQIEVNGKFFDVWSNDEALLKNNPASNIYIDDDLIIFGSVVTPNLLSMQQFTTAKGNVEQLATVEVVITLIDSESGETLTLKGLGSGQDSGDKSIAKSQTMALKYCYLNSLAIAINDDPEADRHTDEVMQHKLAKNPTCNDCGANITQRVA